MLIAETVDHGDDRVESVPATVLLKFAFTKIERPVGPSYSAKSRLHVAPAPRFLPNFRLQFEVHRAAIPVVVYSKKERTTLPELARLRSLLRDWGSVQRLTIPHIVVGLLLQ